MAGTTRYHRLPEAEDDSRPSLDVPDEDARLLDPSADNTSEPSLPKKKLGWNYSFHPTFFLRLLVLIMLIIDVALFIASRADKTIFIIIIMFIAIVRNLLVLIHHLLTRVISIRIRIELRRTGSSISAKKSTWPKWLSGRGAVEVGIDLVLIALLFGATGNAMNGSYNGYWYRNANEATIFSWVICAFNVFTIVDMGRPSRITFTGNLSYDTGNDDEDRKPKPPLEPEYRDVEATGAAEVGMESRKSGTESPVII